MRIMVKTEDAVHERGRAALLLLNSIISLHSKHRKKTTFSIRPQQGPTIDVTLQKGQWKMKKFQKRLKTKEIKVSKGDRHVDTEL